MSAVVKFPRAFAVRFRDLDRWDPMSFHRIRWHWPADVMQPVGSVLTQRKAKIDRTKVAFAELQPITIHFDGSIDKRNVDASREYTMELFAAAPGDIIVSKIDLKNGAVAIVPNDWRNVAVTGHFAVYEPDRSRLVPQYLHLLIQTDFFKSHLWRNKVGAEGRKEVKLDFFEAELIPLPPLPVQRKVVAAWEAAQKSAAATTAQIERLEREIETRFLADLGLKAYQPSPRAKVFAIRWAEINRWGVELAWREQQQWHSCKHGMKPLGDVCKTGTGGTPRRNRLEYFGGGIPWVKTTEVRNNCIMATEETLSSDGMANCQAKLYPAGSIVVAMYGQGATRGRTAKLGIDATTNQACLVMTEFAGGLLPDFVWYYLMARYNDLRGLASGNNQPNLSAELVRAFPIPIPPKQLQRAMIQRAEIGREEIAGLKKEAKAHADATKAGIEAMVLGIKPGR